MNVHMDWFLIIEQPYDPGTVVPPLKKRKDSETFKLVQDHLPWTNKIVTMYVFLKKRY